MCFDLWQWAFEGERWYHLEYKVDVFFTVKQHLKKVTVKPHICAHIHGVVEKALIWGLLTKS